MTDNRNPYPRENRRMSDGETLARLDALAARIDGRLEASEARVDARLERIEDTGTRTLQQAVITNGRLNRAEDRLDALESAHAQAAAIAAAEDTIRRRHAARIAVLIGAVVTIGTGVVIPLLSDLLKELI